MFPKWINVKEAYNRVYRKAGFVPTSNLKNDPNSKSMLEAEARNHALSKLEPEDRMQVNGCVKRLKECCPGVYLGDSATEDQAMQVVTATIGNIRNGVTQ